MSASFTAFYTQELRAIIAQLSHKALRMYVLIATYADKRGVCWPGLKELAERANMRIESVMDGLRELEELALICYARRNERDPLTGQMKSNVYIVSGCLVRSADSGFDPSSELEPIPPFELKTNTTNEITNDNNQSHQNHLQAPPPLTNEKRLEEQQQGSVPPVDYETPKRKKKTKAKSNDQDNSEAKTAPQNKNPPPPPTPPPPWVRRRRGAARPGRGTSSPAALLGGHDPARRWRVPRGALNGQCPALYRPFRPLARKSCLPIGPARPGHTKPYRAHGLPATHVSCSRGARAPGRNESAQRS